MDVVAALRASQRDRFRNWILFASVGLVSLGLAVVSVGLIGDSFNWWQSRPFLANLLSTIGGACFGIPVALVVLRRAEEARHREDSTRRDAAESVLLCERMTATARRIERYWVDLGSDSEDRAIENVGWAALVTEVIGVVDLVRTTDDGVVKELTAATRPLTIRFRLVGMGGVRAAVEDIVQDWARLRQVAGSSTYLRDWENEWEATRIIDVRTFSDILRTFEQRSSHDWCDFFARLPDPVPPNEAVLAGIRQNGQRALRFLYDTGTILARLSGPRNLAPYWLTAIAAYNEIQATQYRDEQMRDDHTRLLDEQAQVRK
jgi:hypothetical protein